jgi:signal transduction histidine kinase/ligand-binding sensor domain-containing protein
MRNSKLVSLRSAFCFVAASAWVTLRAKKQILRILWLCVALATVGVPVLALDPKQPLNQLYHTAWTARNGLTGSVLALAQAADGYLWVGTSDGLFRFDGVEFERYKPDEGSFAASSVSSLLALPDGGLWIGYLRGGASFLKSGRVTNYSERDGFPLAAVRAFAQDWDGTVWVAAVGGFRRLEGHRWQKVGMNWNYPDKAPTALFVDNRGTLWVADTDVIMFLPRGEKKFHNTGIRVNFRATGFAQRPDGTTCLFDSTHDLVQPLRLRLSYAIAEQAQTSSKSTNILLDRSGSLWVVRNPLGLLRIPTPKWGAPIEVGAIYPDTQVFTEQQGLTGRSFTALEDREGNIWIGTEAGLDRFRYRNLTWRQLPAGRHVFSLVAGDHGDVWTGTRGGNLLRVQDDKEVKGGPEDVWVAYRDSSNTIWFSARNVFWKWREGKFSKVAFPEQVTNAVNLSTDKDPILITSITRDQSGSIWVSIAGYGEFQLKNGLWKFAEVLKDHPDWAARAAFTDGYDRLWLVYGEIVAEVDRGQVRSFSAKDGLAVGSPNTVSGYHDHVYVGGEMGVAVLQGNRFRVIKGSDGNDFGLISGIVATSKEGLWLAAGPGIVHIPEREIQNFLQHSDYKVAYELFDIVSDLPEPLQRGAGEEGEYSPDVIRTSDGSLWFATRSGVARVDPARIVRNPLPPPVSIRAVLADDKSYSVSTNVSLPRLTKSLEIDYTALSLSIPERVRFRYRLEGPDEEWQDAGTRRQAFYRDLSPGNYQFHVIACNNDGVWNETGSTLNFTVAPAWYQTKWFKLLAFALTVGITLLLHLFERRRYATLLRVRFDERLEERTRLARDLHDTLLQTIQGSRLVADHARENLNDPSQAEKALDRLCGWLDRATVEGRAALNSLRSSATEKEDLGSALRHIAELCATDSLQVALSVSGVVRSMHPIARDEVFRIGEEAVRNACRHSRATSLAIEARYGANLVLRVRDNGVGLDPALLRSGKPGHFGIIGMRERAARIGARLALQTSPGKGTCLVLKVPGKVIFKSSVVARILQTLRRRVLQN